MDSGLVCAFDINEAGEALPLAAADLTSPIAAGHWRWLHFDRKEEEVVRWLREESGLRKAISDVLTMEETRPRLKIVDDDEVLVLRGVNLNPHAQAEDMISIRVSVETNRVISSRDTKLMAIDAIRQGFAEGHGPRTIGDFIIELADGLTDRMGPIVAGILDDSDRLENSGAEMEIRELRQAISRLRHKIIPLRRYLRPQQDALQSLILAPLDWLTDRQRLRLRDTHDQLTRYIEDLDAARDRADVVQDWLQSHLGERTNRVMLLLSVVTAIFLPLGLLSGVLGMNVSGIPGASSPYAFEIVVGVMMLIAFGLLAVFRFFRIL